MCLNSPQYWFLVYESLFTPSCFDSNDFKSNGNDLSIMFQLALAQQGLAKIMVLVWR